MFDKLRAFCSLPGTDQRQLIAFMAAIALLAVELRWRGMSAAVARVREAGDRATPAAGVDAVRLARLAHLAAHHGPVRGSCLPACLALARTLARLGVVTELHFGVRREGPSLQAHAWLEREGEVLLDTAAGVHWIALGRPAGIA
jgi:hypothetical protein